MSDLANIFLNYSRNTCHWPQNIVSVSLSSNLCSKTCNCYIENIQGIVMVFAVDDQQSFLNIRTWLQNIEDVSSI